MEKIMPETEVSSVASGTIDYRSGVSETSRRLPTFMGGHAIVLADGQEPGWYFPKPILQFRPKFSGGKLSAVVATSLGKEFDEASLGYDASCLNADADPRDPSIPLPIEAAMLVAVTMLRANYSLTDDELCELLVWEPDNEVGDDRWSLILDVARGLGPKAKTAGSA